MKAKCLNCIVSILKANDVKTAKKAKDEDAEEMKKAEENATGEGGGDSGP